MPLSLNVTRVISPLAPEVKIHRYRCNWTSCPMPRALPFLQPPIRRVCGRPFVGWPGRFGSSRRRHRAESRPLSPPLSRFCRRLIPASTVAAARAHAGGWRVGWCGGCRTLSVDDDLTRLAVDAVRTRACNGCPDHRRRCKCSEKKWSRPACMCTHGTLFSVRRDGRSMGVPCRSRSASAHYTGHRQHRHAQPFTATS